MTEIPLESASPAGDARGGPVGRHLVRVRRQVNRLFDGDVPPNLPSAVVNTALAALIVINVTAVILESVVSIRRDHTAAFLFIAIEEVATAVFAVEYVLRVWSAIDRVSGRYRDPLWGRLRYAVRFFSLIDLVSVLPAVLGLLGATDFRTLRLLRLLRMLKLTRRSRTFGLLWNVVHEEARTLFAVLSLVILTLLMSSSMMYMIENEAQPKVFSSIPMAMWWAIETLTTVGYGDIVPITVPGRILGGIVAFVGVGAVALFSGVLTVSFMDQLRLRRDEYRAIVAADLANGRIPDARMLAEIEREGEAMGLSRAAADEVIAEVEAGDHPTHCPHCGGSLGGLRAPVTQELR